MSSRSLGEEIDGYVQYLKSKSKACKLASERYHKMLALKPSERWFLAADLLSCDHEYSKKTIILRSCCGALRRVGLVQYKWTESPLLFLLAEDGRLDTKQGESPKVRRDQLLDSKYKYFKVCKEGTNQTSHASFELLDANEAIQSYQEASSLQPKINWVIVGVAS